MTPPESPDHEALCRRCGRCCYEKLILDSHVFTTRAPCAFLDTRTNLCTVYDRRFEANPRCLSVEEGIRYGVFPADCPYVRDLPDYHPAVDGWLDDDTVRRIESGEIRSCEDVLDALRQQNDAG